MKQYIDISEVRDGDVAESIRYEGHSWRLNTINSRNDDGIWAAYIGIHDPNHAHTNGMFPNDGNLRFYREVRDRPSFAELTEGMTLRIAGVQSLAGIHDGTYRVTGRRSDNILQLLGEDGRDPWLTEVWYDNHPDNFQPQEEPMTITSDFDTLKADFEAFAKALHDEATTRGFCAEYDNVIERVNETLTHKVPTREDLRTYRYQVSFSVELDNAYDPDIVSTIRRAFDQSTVRNLGHIDVADA